MYCDNAIVSRDCGQHRREKLNCPARPERRTFKVLPYAALGLIDLRNMLTSAVLLPLAPLGVWVGVKLVRRIDPTWFYRLVHLGMLLSGGKLLWDGLQ